MVSGLLVKDGAGSWCVEEPGRAAAVADRRGTGLSREVLAELVGRVGPALAGAPARTADRSPRQRAIGAGARHRLVFIDRLLATLVHLRHGVAHDVLACWFGVSRSTITRAVSEVRPLLAERGCTVAGGIRLHTLADVVAHLGASGQLGLLDATEVRVRRPAAHKAGRTRFVPARPGPTPPMTPIITDPAVRPRFRRQTALPPEPCRGRQADHHGVATAPRLHPHDLGGSSQADPVGLAGEQTAAQRTGLADLSRTRQRGNEPEEPRGPAAGTAGPHWADASRHAVENRVRRDTCVGGRPSALQP
jgi:DDE superfamily endonuclease